MERNKDNCKMKILSYYNIFNLSLRLLKYCQNALAQSNSRIFISTLSLKQNDEKAWFFACWCKFMETESWLRNIGMDVVRNECDHSGVRTQKLAVSQEGINGILIFGLLIKNLESQKLVLVILKPAESQEWINEMSWFWSEHVAHDFDE